MDQQQNPQQYQAAGGQPYPPQPSSIPPPPPPTEQQVGVRSMTSDLESIRQTGGEAPQSQIVSAPELSGEREPSPPPSYVPPPPPSRPIPPPPPAFGTQIPSSVPQQTPAQTVPAPTAPPTAEQPEKKAMNLKSILLIVGVGVAAVAVGIGVYYLVSSLGQETVEVVTPQAPADQSFPPLEPEPTPPPSPQPPTPPPFVHVSLIANPADAATVTMTELTATSVKSGIAAIAPSQLLVGTVRDMTFVDVQNTTLKSPVILGTLLPGAAPSLSLLFEEDFTSWLYGDKVGGNKLGFAFTLRSEAPIAQAAQTVQSVLEGALTDIPNLFLSSVKTPSPVEFKDGQVEGVPVRFLAFNPKSGQVLEYGWLSVSGRTHLVITTSYTQMVDIVKRLTATGPAQ